MQRACLATDVYRKLLHYHVRSCLSVLCVRRMFLFSETNKNLWQSALKYNFQRKQNCSFEINIFPAIHLKLYLKNKVLYLLLKTITGTPLRLDSGYSFATTIYKMRAHGQDSGNNRSIILIMYIGYLEKNFAILMDKDTSNFLKPCVPPFYLVKYNYISSSILY